jgi:hypothetical protein
MFTADRQAFLIFSTSSKDLMDRDALISRGSKPQERAAHKASVVFPIPGGPLSMMAFGKVLEFK